jgi:iron complex outermembrane receptor protein
MRKLYTAAQQRNLTKLIFLLLFLLAYAPTRAQSGSVTGSVTITDGNPAIGVSLGLKATSLGSIADKSGNYSITNVKPGSYIIRVQMLGLEPQEQSIKVIAGEQVTADFVLRESAATIREVVVTARRDRYKATLPSETLRLQTPLLEIPQNIQVITSTVIEDQQLFNMLEGVARNVSGVTMQEHWGNYTRMNMRGARVAPFRNGMNVESAWGPLSEDMSFVERIEFVKGPAGFMLANGDPAGFYNVVTKKPTGLPKREISLTYGSFGTYRATADLDGKLTGDGKLLYRLNLMGQKQESWRDFEYNDRYAIAPVLRYRFSDKTSLTAEYTYQFSRMSAIGSAYVFSARSYADLPRSFTIADPNLEPSDMRDNSAFLTFEHAFSEEWKLTAQAAYFHYSQEGSSLWLAGVDANGDMQRTLSSWDARNRSRFGQLFVNGQVQTGPVSHTLLGGVDYGNKEYIADWNQYFMLAENTPFNIYNPVYGLAESNIPVIDRSEPLEVRAAGNILAQQYGALYLQDELGFFKDRLRLTLAGRYTTAETNQYTTIIKNGRFTPRLGLSASVSKGTSLYALYDQSFIPQNGRLANEAEVKPITGNNTEIGVKKDWFGGRWNSTVSAYQITKNNQLVADPNDSTQTFSLQLGQTMTKGVEVDVRGEVAPGLQLTFNYAFTDSEITKDTNPARVGTKVPGHAGHVTNAWLSYKTGKGLLKGAGVSLGYQWQLGRYPWFVADGSGHQLPDYFRLDGAVSYQYRSIRFALNVNNLLDEYLYSGSPYDFDYNGTSDGFYWQAEAPRNFRFTVGYKF